MEATEITKTIEIKIDNKDRSLCGRGCEYQSNHGDPKSPCYLFFREERKKDTNGKLTRTPQCKSRFGN